jgi:hypothetical protein
MCEGSSLHNLTDMGWKASAGFGLRVDRVPVVYHRLASRHAKSCKDIVYVSSLVQHDGTCS